MSCYLFSFIGKRKIRRRVVKGFQSLFLPETDREKRELGGAIFEVRAGLLSRVTSGRKSCELHATHTRHEDFWHEKALLRWLSVVVVLCLFVGLFERNRCPRGKNCNFLHVYRNPGNEFSHRDDRSPNRTPFDGGRTSERSERGWRRDQWSRRRDPDRDQSRDRDWEQDSYRKRRLRDWGRDRDDYRRRHRRRSEERERGGTSERHENREQRNRRRSYSSDEGSERETEHKHLSER